MNTLGPLGPVNTGLPTDRRIIDRAVNGFGDIGPNTELEGPHFIDAVVRYMDSLNERDDEGYGTHGDNTHPWMGDEAYVHVVPGRDCVLIRTAVWEGEIYLQFLDSYGSNSFGRFASYEVTGPDGLELPSWIKPVRGDIVIIERPADAEVINLEVRTVMERGGSAIIPISIDLVTGEITAGAVASESAEAEGLGFSQQIAAITGEREAEHDQLMAALRSLKT